MNWNNIELPDKNIYFQDDLITIYHGDCREILPSLKSISAVVTDPPYGLGFMNKEWDNPQKERELIEREKRRSEQRFKEGKSPTTAPFSQSMRPGLPIGGAKEGRWFQEWCYEWAFLLREACLPGAMLLSFGSTRTSHRIACAIEDAGWQIRDTICWVYGSGFPKSLNISKQLDGVVGKQAKGFNTAGGKEKFDNQDKSFRSDYGYTYNPTTPEAKLWEGYGTALKPAYEPIIVAMNPIDGTFADNALKHKVAGLNIDECRIGVNGGGTHCNNRDRDGKCSGHPDRSGTAFGLTYHTAEVNKPKGRFPSNFIHDGSQEVMELFPETSRGWGQSTKGTAKGSGSMFGSGGTNPNRYDMGELSAARFFYCAKSSRRERDAGLEDMPEIEQTNNANFVIAKCKKCGKWIGNDWRRQNRPLSNCQCESPEAEENGKGRGVIKNNHPTVKPLALMTYLCSLVKMPEYNLILDPFCGSGTTLLACKKLGIKAIGIEASEEYCEIAAKRVSRA